MKAPLNAIEKGTLIVAVICIAIGAYAVVRPKEMFLDHPKINDGYIIPLSPPYSAEHVSAGKSRVYGIALIGFGIAIGSAAFYRRC